MARVLICEVGAGAASAGRRLEAGLERRLEPIGVARVPLGAALAPGNRAPAPRLRNGDVVLLVLGRLTAHAKAPLAGTAKALHDALATWVERCAARDIAIVPVLTGAESAAHAPRKLLALKPIRLPAVRGGTIPANVAARIARALAARPAPRKAPAKKPALRKSAPKKGAAGKRAKRAPAAAPPAAGAALPAPDRALFSARTRPTPPRMATRGAPMPPAGAEPPAGATAPAPRTTSAAPEPEPVLLGASAPRAVRPGDEFTARFVAYLKAAEEEVKATLASLSPRSEHRLGLKSCRWQPGTKVRVALSGRHLSVSPQAQEFVWEGDRQLVEFDAAVADDAPDGPVVLKFDASVDGIVVAMLRLDLEINRAKPDGRPAKASGTAARTAFASYSSKDRERVLDRVAAVRISAGLDIFLDCLSLHPSEEWKPQLAEAIRGRDLFLLFWSQEAAQSKWVTWEWQTALEQKGREGMQIHPLETGVRPPEQLRDLHFGDVFMLIREAQEAKRARPAPGGSS